MKSRSWLVFIVKFGLWLSQSGQARVEVEVDSRVHSRLIGTRGRTIRKIMDQFNVEIKFPRPQDSAPDLVVITGAEPDCEEAKDHLLNLEEEYVSCNSKCAGGNVSSRTPFEGERFLLETDVENKLDYKLLM